MLLYIYGEDDWRSHNFLRQSVNEFKAKRDPQGYNTLSFDAQKDEPNKMVGELLALPFLAEKRMIVLKNPLSSSNKEFLEKLSEIIKENKLPETNVAIIWQAEAIGKTNEAKKLAEILKKQKYAYEFPAMDRNELVSWIVKEVAARGASIDRMATQKIADDIGRDMWLVNSVIDQLVAYKKGGEIRSADVALFAEEKIEDNIFNLVDAIVAGNKKLAFKLLDDERKSGEDDAFIFSMMLRQFKILVQMRDLWEREDNLTSDQIAKTLGLHPFVAKKSLPQVRRYGLGDLQRAYDGLLDVDVGLKTGLAKYDLLVDLFVGKM
jgi:DNA polymerase III subunit delta